MKKNNPVPAPKKILIVRLDRIGDVVLSTPVIKALRAAYPDSHIAFLVRPYAADAVIGNPYLDEVITFNKERTFSFAMGLRKKKFDMAVILHPTERTHWIAFLAGIPIRVGYDLKMGILLTRRVPHTKQYGLKHEIDNGLDILRYVGIENKERELYFPINSQSEIKIANMFARNHIQAGDKVVVINPSASCRSKMWRPENFAILGDKLVEKFGAKIIVLGDTADIAISDSVTNAMKKPSINLAGKTTVSDIASILKRAKLFISNDSGPVHIARAIGTPVIAIFGRSDRGLSPKRWGPTGPHDLVIHKDAGCEICLAHNCIIAFKCLELVTPAEVIQAASTILS
jgi:lipopolysaccharide heptosyltransferase II